MDPSSENPSNPFDPWQINSWTADYSDLVNSQKKKPLPKQGLFHQVEQLKNILFVGNHHAGSIAANGHLLENSGNGSQSNCVEAGHSVADQLVD